MKTIQTLFLSLWLAAMPAVAPLHAAAQVPAQTNVAAILEAMRQASGGDAWKEVHALHMAMNVRSGGQDVRADRWEDVVTGRYMDHYVRSSVTTQDGFDGVVSWRQGRSGIAYTLGDVDAGLVAADEAFRVARGWWFPDRYPATIGLVGVRKESGRVFDVLQVTPEGGRMFEAWIDQATHLLARTDEQQAEDRVVTLYSDYRRIQGMVLPFTIALSDGTDDPPDEVATVQSIEVNPDIPDDRYALPPLPASDIALPAHRDSVEVPFRLTADNRILVPLTVNGRATYDAEFDSGGSLILQPAAVAALNIDVAGHSRAKGGGEGEGPVSTRGHLERISIGGAAIGDVAFHSLAFNPGEPDRALVGLEVLQRFVVRFDFDRGVMTLTRPDAFTYSGSGSVIPFHFQDNQPEVRGSVDGIAGLFAIDTGDSGSLLLIAPFARRYGLVDRYHADLPYAGQALGATHGVWARKRVQTVSLDGADGRAAAVVHEPVTRISLQHSGFDANRNVSANIGLGILKQFNLTFDYPRQRIILEANHLYGQKDIFNRAGLRLTRKGDGWSVSAVYAGGPAADAGIETGEVVARIDDQAPDTLSQEQLAAKLIGATGSMLRLQIATPGNVRSVTLVLRDIL
jgi:hypothetical protein